jgi:hypothetical protein
MITVEKVQRDNKKQEKFANAAAQEQLKTGEIKAVKQGWWPIVLSLVGLAAFSYWFWKKGKQTNGEVPG